MYGSFISSEEEVCRGWICVSPLDTTLWSQVLHLGSLACRSIGSKLWERHSRPPLLASLRSMKQSSTVANQWYVKVMHPPRVEVEAARFQPGPVPLRGNAKLNLSPVAGAGRRRRRRPAGQPGAWRLERVGSAGPCWSGSGLEETQCAIPDGDMTRLSRVALPGALYHVTARGNERELIYMFRCPLVVQLQCLRVAR